MGVDVELRDVAVSRGLVGGPFGSSLVGKDYTAAGVPVIRGGNMGPGQWVGGDFAFVSPEKFRDELSRNSAAPGDLVFTQRGTLGQVAIVPDAPFESYVVSQSQMRLRVDEGRFDSRFVFYACSSADFRKQISDHAISTGVPHINLGILSGLKIPNLALGVQRGIAEVLGALDDKIAANAILVTTADELARHVTRAAMTGFTQALASVAEITMGSSPPGTSYNESGEGVVFYQGVRDFGVRFPSNRIWTTEPVRLADLNDTLVSVRAPVGRTNLANERTCIGRGLAAVKSTSGRSFSMFHILRDSPDAWAPYEAEGTVFGSINKQQLAALHVGVIDESQSDRVERELASLEGRIGAAIGESGRLADLRDVLLPQLMSGKIRVKDAERVVEGVV